MSQIIRKDEPAGLIASLLASYSTYVRQQFDLFLRSVRENTVLESIVQALTNNNLNQAFEVIDSYVIRLGNAITSLIPAIGRVQAQATAADVGLARAGVSVAFDPTAPEIVEAMERNSLEFVSNFSNDQRLVVVNSLAQSIQQGVGIPTAALRIRDVIGLTAYQQSMVDNYRTLLETNNQRALSYALRDRRYDTGFENAIEEDVFLPGNRINLMVDRYRERLLQFRGETIARTETARIVEESRALGLEQAIEQADIPRNVVVKEWVSTGVRTRDTHDSMNGQARLFDDAFDSPSGAQLMQPGDSNAPAAEIINCRCTVKHHVFSTEEEAQEYLIANGQGRYS